MTDIKIVERPTSPHLSVYKPQISSVMSIMHRFTGIVLSAGGFLIVIWLWCAAYSARDYRRLHELLATPFGQILLLAWVFAFFYHLGNGIRHLLWDIGYGYELPKMHRSGVLAIVFAVGMTALVWFLAQSGQTGVWP